MMNIVQVVNYEKQCKEIMNISKEPYNKLKLKRLCYLNMFSYRLFHSTRLLLPISCQGQECVEPYLRAPSTPLWRRAQLKMHGDKFTFYPVPHLHCRCS